MGKAKRKRRLEEEAEEEEGAAPSQTAKKHREKEQHGDDGAPPLGKSKKGTREGQTEDAPEPRAEAPPTAARKSGKRKPVDDGQEAEPEAPAAGVSGEEPAEKRKKGKRRAEEDVIECGEEPAQPGGDGGPAKKEKKKKPPAAPEAEAEKVAEADPAFEPGTVFVGGIPWSCTATILRRDFEECGEVANVNLLTDAITGKSRGIAFVTFADEAGVEAALKFDGDDYGGRILKVRRAEASAVRDSRTSSGNYEVFVRGLPADTSEDSLRKRFSDCGTIERLNLPTRGSGKCKGFAWLTFTSKADMESALKLNGAESGSAKLLVEVAGEHKPAGAGADRGKGKGKGKSGGKVSTEREVFISNLAYEANEAELRKDFSECGEIERMHMPTRDSKSMGFAWITFASEDGMDRALSYNGDTYGGRRLRVEKSGQHKGVSRKDNGTGEDLKN